MSASSIGIKAGLAMAAALALSAGSSAQMNLDSWRVSEQLGAVLGSEAACGLSYDPAAIDRFIDESVAADDMEFTSNLGVNTRSTVRQVEDMSASTLTAHCAQIRRVARSYGFVAN